MIEFGATLRAAREAKGLTPAQLAQTTHLMAQQIEALENEDFSKIAAPIYGRGFVKLYCEGVGLDPKPMVDEFMEIFSGNRQPAIRMRPPAPKATPAPVAPVETPAEPVAPEPAVRAEPPPAFDGIAGISSFAEPVAAPVAEPEPVRPVEDTPDATPTQDFFLESVVVRQPKPAPAPEPAPAPMAADTPTDGLLFPPEEVAPTASSRKPSRFAAPVPIDDDDGAFRFTLPHIPRSVWRILALALVGLFLLWLIYSCLSALYHAASDTTTPEQEDVSTEASAEQARPAVPATERSEKAISPLYID